MTRKVVTALGLSLLGLAACATTPAPSTEIAAAGASAPPAGFLDLCRRAPDECGSGWAAADARPAATPEFWKLLSTINHDVNASMRSRTDREAFGEEEHWASASDRQDAGDCEDFALAKRRALARAGVPRGALSLAVVDSAASGRHVVLVVATANGDYVLDMLSPWVRPWRETGYVFLQRQNPDGLTWSAINASEASVASPATERRLTFADLAAVSGRNPAAQSPSFASRRK